MFWLNLVKSLVQVLHSDISPRQVAAGAALGAIIGLMPVFTLQTVLIFLLILILQVNIGSAVLAMGIFKLVAFIIDPLANWLGYLLLVKTGPLIPLWTSLYNTPVVPFTRFYNTVVLGSFIIALLLFVPIYLLTQKLILHYRGHFREKVEKLKIVKLLKLTSVFNIYDRYKQ